MQYYLAIDIGASSDVTSLEQANVIGIDYSYDLYDDTGMTFEELETATEPLRDPEKRPAWKEYEE